MSDEGTQVTTGDASLLDHSDRRKWNDKHAAAEPTFGTHPLVTRALDSGLRSGAVLELACGISGSALHLAGLGFSVTAVDVSDIALLRLMSEARHRGTEDRVIAVWEDLAAFEPANEAFELVLCTYYWNSALFTRACAAVTPGACWHGRRSLTPNRASGGHGASVPVNQLRSCLMILWWSSRKTSPTAGTRPAGCSADVYPAEGEADGFVQRGRGCGAEPCQCFRVRLFERDRVADDRSNAHGGGGPGVIDGVADEHELLCAEV